MSLFGSPPSPLCLLLSLILVTSTSLPRWRYFEWSLSKAIRGWSKEKLDQGRGLEYLSSRRWLRKLCLFYKTVVNKSWNYFYNYASTINQQPYQTRSSNKFLQMSCLTEYFANSYFPHTIKKWNNLSLKMCKSVSYEVLKNFLLKFKDLVHIVCLMFLIVLKSNFLTVYVWHTLENINSTTIFRTL